MDNIIKISTNVLELLLLWAVITGLMVLVTRALRKLFKENIVQTSISIAVGILVVGIFVYAADQYLYLYTKSIGTTETPIAATANTKTGNSAIDTEEEYIGNVQSKKFHRPSCDSLPTEGNRIIYKTREAAVNAGMIPCKLCNP